VAHQLQSGTQDISRGGRAASCTACSDRGAVQPTHVVLLCVCNILIATKVKGRSVQRAATLQRRSSLGAAIGGCHAGSGQQRGLQAPRLGTALMAQVWRRNPRRGSGGGGGGLPSHDRCKVFWRTWRQRERWVGSGHAWILGYVHATFLWILRLNHFRRFGRH
jgi:hypothetical protein